MFTLLKFFVLTGTVGTAVAIPTSLLSSSSTEIETIAPQPEGSTQPLLSIPLPKRTLTSEGQDRAQDESETIQPQQPKKLDECKVIGKSDIDGRLVACRDKEDDTKVKFSWYEHLLVDSMPKYLKNLKFTSSELVVELEGEVDYGSHRRFEHSPEIFQRKGPIIFTNGPSFKEEQCLVEWILDSHSQERIDWRVHCSSPKV